MNAYNAAYTKFKKGPPGQQDAHTGQRLTKALGPPGQLLAVEARLSQLGLTPYEQQMQRLTGQATGVLANPIRTVQYCMSKTNPIHLLHLTSKELERLSPEYSQAHNFLVQNLWENPYLMPDEKFKIYGPPDYVRGKFNEGNVDVCKHEVEVAKNILDIGDIFTWVCILQDVLMSGLSICKPQKRYLDNPAVLSALDFLNLVELDPQSELAKIYKYMTSNSKDMGEDRKTMRMMLGLPTT